MSRSKRDYGLARAKVDESPGCRVCGRQGALESAHLAPRSRVPPGAGENPANIVPLCREDHCAFDERRLDLLPYLTPEEQATMTFLMGGIINALERATSAKWSPDEIRIRPQTSSEP